MSGIRTHPANDAYRSNWDRIFGKQKEQAPEGGEGRCDKRDGEKCKDCGCDKEKTK